MSGRGALDDAELRRTLDAVLSGPVSASRREGASLPPEPPRAGARQGASDPPPRPGPDPGRNQRHVASGGWMMERRGLVVLGLILVAIGALLLGDTLGLLALDTRRLADYWPLVFVLIGLLVLLEAWSPGRRPDLREPAAGMPDATEADALERRLARLLALQPSAAAPPAAAAAADQPGAHQPAMDPEPRHADTVAALLDLQGLRRNRLISKREYRAKRADLVARMSPYPAARYAEGGFAAGEGGSDLGGVPTSGAWPGRPPR